MHTHTHTNTAAPQYTISIGLTEADHQAQDQMAFHPDICCSIHTCTHKHVYMRTTVLLGHCTVLGIG